MVEAPSIPTASLARIEANRRNALRSTGPKTAEGKDRSRRNAIKHGLSARIVGPEVGEEDRASRAGALMVRYAPSDEWGRWLVDRVAATSVQIDEADRAEAAARLVASARADSTEAWEIDRKIEAERTAERIRSRPAEVVRRLMMTAAGCDWLIDRWSALLANAREIGAWSPEQWAVAQDLLGTPVDLRDASPPSSGTGLEAPAELVDLASMMIEQVNRARLDAEEFDEIARLATLAGDSDNSSPALRKFRRHQADLWRRLRRLLDRLKDHVGGREAEEDAPPAPPAPPAPQPVSIAPVEPVLPGSTEAASHETNPNAVPTTVAEPSPRRPERVEAGRTGRDVRAQSTPRGKKWRRRS